MLACSALLVQYTVESELGRTCDVGAPGTDGRPLEITTCELENIVEALPAQYTLLRPISAALAALLLSDVVLCVVYAKLQRLTPQRQYAHDYLLLLVYALVALLPCVGYTIVAAVALPYTTDAHLGYLIAVGSLLALSCARRVRDSLKSLKGEREHILAAGPAVETAEVLESRFGTIFEDEADSFASAAARELPKGARFGAILRGTAQSGARKAETKKVRCVAQRESGLVISCLLQSSEHKASHRAPDPEGRVQMADCAIERLVKQKAREHPRAKDAEEDGYQQQRLPPAEDAEAEDNHFPGAINRQRE